MELQELLAHYGKERLTILRLDVLDEASIEAAADVVEQRFGRCDLLINASGVLHIPGELQPGARALGRARSSVRACPRLTRRLLAETALAALTVDALTYAYRVNAIGACARAACASHAFAEQPRDTCAGPTLVLKAFSPLLRRTAAANATRRGSTVAPTVAANLSARVSSIRENRLGGWHSYRASKTALNMLTKSAAVELGQGSAPVICLLLHPGTVATDLSRPFNRNGAPPRSVPACVAPRRALTLLAAQCRPRCCSRRRRRCAACCTSSPRRGRTTRASCCAGTAPRWTGEQARSGPALHAARCHTA